MEVLKILVFQSCPSSKKPEPPILYGEFSKDCPSIIALLKPKEKTRSLRVLLSYFLGLSEDSFPIKITSSPVEEPEPILNINRFSLSLISSWWSLSLLFNKAIFTEKF